MPRHTYQEGSPFPSLRVTLGTVLFGWQRRNVDGGIQANQQAKLHSARESGSAQGAPPPPTHSFISPTSPAFGNRTRRGQSTVPPSAHRETKSPHRGRAAPAKTHTQKKRNQKTPHREQKKLPNTNKKKIFFVSLCACVYRSV